MAPSKPVKEWKPVKVLPEVGALCLEGLIDSSDEKDFSQTHTQRDTHMHTPNPRQRSHSALFFSVLTLTVNCV